MVGMEAGDSGCGGVLVDTSSFVAVAEEELAIFWVEEDVRSDVVATGGVSLIGIVLCCCDVDAVFAGAPAKSDETSSM